MKLTEDQQKIFERWVRTRCPSLKCALCQTSRWKIGDLLVPTPTNPLNDLGAHEPVMTQLVCKNCAHVVLFDVRRIEGWHDDNVGDSSQTMIF